jgi:hypothetical protein
LDLAELLKGELIDEVIKFGRERGRCRGLCRNGRYLFRGITKKVLRGDAEIVGDSLKGSLARNRIFVPAGKRCGSYSYLPANKRGRLAFFVAKINEILLKHGFSFNILKSF